MPYWTSSRVGPIGNSSLSSANATASNHSDKTAAKLSSVPSRSSKRKGITMEDLKKQTALRLAKEQGRVEKTQGSVEASPRRFTASPSPHGSKQQPLAPHHGTASPYSSKQKQQQRTPVSTPDRFVGSAASSVNNTPQQQFYDDAHQQQLQMYSTPPPSIDRRNHHLSSNMEVPSASRSVDSATDMGANAKLPHGLTVQELKEMTKARLQAEAAEKSTLLIPSTVRVSGSTGREPPILTSPSPIPIYNRTMVARSPHDLEAWENASVSTSASDYPGTESVYSVNGQASFNGDDQQQGMISITRSYQQQQVLQDTTGSWREQPPPNIGSYHYAGAADGYAPNRRRAATLSPRPAGGGLSHLHEDRPLLLNSGGPMPPLPTDFAASESCGLHSFPMRTRSDFTPRRDYGNRDRTNSAVSLPALSHTAEEFHGSEYLHHHHGRPPFGSTPSRFDSVDEDMPLTSLSDVFRGTSPIDAGLCFGGSSHTNNNASSLGLGSSATESFTEPSRLRASTDVIDSFGFHNPFRDRAATWSNSEVFDIFSCGQDLTEDLASILKLSGAEQKDDSSP